MKKFYTMLVALCVAVAANAADWYLIGAFNGWTLGDESAKFTQQEDGTFVLELEELTSSFKINDGDWVNQFSSNGAEIELGKPYSVKSGDGANMTFLNIGAITNARLVLNTSNNTLTITGVEKEIDLAWFLCGINGEWGDWSDKYKFTKTDTKGVFELKGVELNDSTTKTIKVSAANWIEQYGANADSQAINNDCLSTSLGKVSYGGDIQISLSGTWDVTWDYNNLIISFSPGSNSGVENIEFNAAEPIEYYNLQGIRVNSPTSGLFIAKQGNKTTKVFVK